MPIRIVLPLRWPGFDMVRSGQVPSTIRSYASLPACDILSGEGVEDFLHWAVPRGAHCPNGVEESAGLPKGLLALSSVKLRRPVDSMLFEAAGK